MVESAATISALSFEGLIAITADGKPAEFAIVDGEGTVIASGPHVAQAAWQTSVNAYRRFLMAEGHLRVMAKVESLAEVGQSLCRESDNAVTISALSWQGLSAFAPDGSEVLFAIVDQGGKIVAAGKLVAEATWEASVNAYRQFLIENGHLRVWTREEAMALRSQWGFGDDNDSD